MPLTIKYLVDQKINNFVPNRRMFAQPNVILIHPDDAWEFIKEVFYNADSLGLQELKDINPHDIVYLGYRVIRSEDIKKGEVEVF